MCSTHNEPVWAQTPPWLYGPLRRPLAPAVSRCTACFRAAPLTPPPLSPEGPKSGGLLCRPLGCKTAVSRSPNPSTPLCCTLIFRVRLMIQSRHAVKTQVCSVQIGHAAKNTQTSRVQAIDEWNQTTIPLKVRGLVSTAVWCSTSTVWIVNKNPWKQQRDVICRLIQVISFGTNFFPAIILTITQRPKLHYGEGQLAFHIDQFVYLFSVFCKRVSTTLASSVDLF